MESIWTKTCQLPQREPLPGDKTCEIAVIGGGMAGILIASFLQDSGHSVIVLEGNRIASGQTRNTTAKITSQHGLIYAKLIETMGKERAAQYAMANEAAIDVFRRIIHEKHIDCDFEECSAYVYGKHTDILKKEANAAKMLKLPAVYVEDETLPFEASGAVRFDGQAQFHPLKFLQALAEPLTIFEQTMVRKVEGNQIITDRGTVKADKIIFACHYPFVNFPGMYFARMHQERSYVLALKHADIPKGMWIGAEKGAPSVRTYGDLLLLGGGSHRTGENKTGGQYEWLRQQARRWFSGSQEVACWSAQDCMTADGVPYIGQYAASEPDWYVATGFQKWGMTSAMVSAMLLTDQIEGRGNPFSQVFDPGRFDTAAAAGIMEEGKQAVKGLTKRILQIPEEQASALPAGQGGIVSLNGEKVGVYKREDGKLFPVEIKCPHLGCQLEWNPEEKSWDCPCHGSRFDRFGTLISGPAQEGICETGNDRD